jgi:hypothetical protein
MLKQLAAEGPAPDRAAPMMLYGQFVGSWKGTVVVHLPDGARRESTCEVHFGWALEGRSIRCDRHSTAWSGDEIVQQYRDAQDARCQWLFTEITADSFHWIARESTDDGKSWKRTGEFFLRRA